MATTTTTPKSKFFKYALIGAGAGFILGSLLGGRWFLGSLLGFAAGGYMGYNNDTDIKIELPKLKTI